MVGFSHGKEGVYERKPRQAKMTLVNFYNSEITGIVVIDLSDPCKIVVVGVENSRGALTPIVFFFNGQLVALDAHLERQHQGCD